MAGRGHVPRLYRSVNKCGCVAARGHATVPQTAFPAVPASGPWRHIPNLPPTSLPRPQEGGAHRLQPTKAQSLRHLKSPNA